MHDVIDTAALAGVTGGQIKQPPPVTLTREHSERIWPSLPALPPKGPDEVDERAMVFPGGSVMACERRNGGAPSCSLFPAPRPY